jgi:hypothetical protein
MRVLVLMLIVLSPPPCVWHHALPCRQMTAIVHHAGLGASCFQTDRVCVGVEMRVANRVEEMRILFVTRRESAAHGESDPRYPVEGCSRMAEVDVVGSAGSHEHLSLLVDVLKKKFGLPEERAVAVALRV